MLYVHNVSDQPIVLRSVHLSGSGLGTTVRAIEIEAAPELPGIHAIPGGAYRTDPPVWRDPQGACHSAVLRPLEGFSLAAGGEMRVWVVLETLAPGAFLIRSHTVSYSQGGLDYEQVLPIGYRGEVERGADPPRLDRTERPCLARTSVLEAKGEPARSDPARTPACGRCRDRRAGRRGLHRHGGRRRDEARRIRARWERRSSWSLAAQRPLLLSDGRIRGRGRARLDEGREVTDVRRVRCEAEPSATAGFDRWVLAVRVHRAPRGGAMLAQWSGECEAPTAYWVDLNGTERIVTGEKPVRCTRVLRARLVTGRRSACLPARGRVRERGVPTGDLRLLRSRSRPPHLPDRRAGR